MVTSKGIAVIGGTGQQGFGLALRWARAGKRVLIGSRQASKAVAAAGKITEIAGDAVQAEGLENSEAVSRTNLVVLTVPFEAQAPILKGLRGSFKPGHILIDVTVPLESAIGGSFTRVMSVWAGSAAEQAALLAGPEVGVASAFHNISAPALNDIDKPVDCDVIVCGDSPEAKEAAKELVGLIPNAGFVDGGPLANSRTVEALTPLLIGINIRNNARSAGIRVTGLPHPTR